MVRQAGVGRGEAVAPGPQRRAQLGVLAHQSSMRGPARGFLVPPVPGRAGRVGSRKPAGEVSAADMQATYDTNVFGVVRVTRAFLPLLEKSGASVIVNVSSGLGSLAAARTRPGSSPRS